MICKKLGSALRNDLRLVLHILTASRDEHRNSKRRGHENVTIVALGGEISLHADPCSLIPGRHQYSTSTTETGCKAARYARDSTRSNFGSSASRHRKNLSDVAPSRKFGALNSG